VLQKYTKQASPEILSQTYDYFAQNTPVMPLTEAEAIQPALASAQPSNRKVEDFYDDSLLEELAREGFIMAATNKGAGKTAARRSPSANPMINFFAAPI